MNGKARILTVDDDTTFEEQQQQAQEGQRPALAEPLPATPARRQCAAALEACNQELDAYAHTLVHGLRVPLGHLVSYAELLEDEGSALSDKERRALPWVIVGSGYQMCNVIDEFLLLAALREAKAETGPLDMASIVAQAKHRSLDLVEKFAGEITSPQTWPVALGYGPWVEEVWVRFISNAIKYGGRPDEDLPPRIELGYDVWGGERASANGRLSESGRTRSPAESQIRLWVRDNGPGLTPQEQARLFRPFPRLEEMETRERGLGLFVARRIVEKLGGEVGVESVVGRGSTFSFTVPSGAGQKPASDAPEGVM